MQQLIQRYHFNKEFTRMMVAITKSELMAGWYKKNVTLQLARYAAFLHRYFSEELRPVDFTPAVAVAISEHRTPDDPIPYSLTSEQEAFIYAMHEISFVLIECGYLHNEKLRIVHMFQTLMRLHLKGDDDMVDEIRRILLQLPQ